MKKSLILIMAAIVMTLTSCGGDTPADINKKIEHDEILSQKEYKVMIDYLQEPWTMLAQALSEGMAMNFVDFSVEIEKVSEQYPYTDTFTQYLGYHVADLDRENLEAFNKLQKLIINATPQPSTPETIKQKIDAQQPLDQQDYAVIIEYIADALAESQQGSDTWKTRYPYVAEFTGVIVENAGELNEENAANFGQLGQSVNALTR